MRARRSEFLIGVATISAARLRNYAIASRADMHRAAYRAPDDRSARSIDLPRESVANQSFSAALGGVPVRQSPDRCETWWEEGGGGGGEREDPHGRRFSRATSATNVRLDASARIFESNIFEIVASSRE